MQLYGLIGYPLGHSFSKKYFTEKFEKEGLFNCRFESFSIENINDFPEILKANPSLKGLSVTIPYKEQVLKFVTELSEEVKIIGATNSIKIAQNRLIAFNTDITGFEISFLKKLQPKHIRALVLGTGGASKAVQYILKKNNIEFLTVTRNTVLKEDQINYSFIGEDIMNNYPVIINSSPAGMSPNENTFPNLPYHFITPNHYFFDLVYKPDKTLFLQKAEEKGAIIQNGFDMLIEQAEASWKLWNTD